MKRDLWLWNVRANP